MHKYNARVYTQACTLSRKIRTITKKSFVIIDGNAYERTIILYLPPLARERYM